ncbi:hypothetical protein Tco_1241776 [Tanacetum coccineum]
MTGLATYVSLHEFLHFFIGCRATIKTQATPLLLNWFDVTIFIQIVFCIERLAPNHYGSRYSCHVRMVHAKISALDFKRFCSFSLKFFGSCFPMITVCSGCSSLIITLSSAFVQLRIPYTSAGEASLIFFSPSLTLLDSYVENTIVWGIRPSDNKIEGLCLGKRSVTYRDFQRDFSDGPRVFS